MVESQVVLTPRARKAERYATTLALIVTLGPLFYGFEGMVLNGAISAVGSEFQLGSFAKGVAGAAGIIGGLIGSLIAGRLSDYIGRRGVLLLVGPFLMFEAIFGALCPYLGGYPFLLFCRIVGGMGFGAATTVAPGYVAEISPARIRGRLISFRQLAIILGLLFAAVVNLVMTNLAGDSSAEVFLGIKAWQCMFLCLIVPALVYMILMPFIPESPRYLVSKGRNEQAAKVLERLSGTDDVTAQVESIQRSLGGVNEALGIFAVLRSKWRGLVCVGMALAAFQQLTGTNGIFFYSNTLFEAVGVPESAAFQQTLILTVFKIIGVTAGILLVDRVGRKRMLMYGGTLIFHLAGRGRHRFHRRSERSQWPRHQPQPRARLPRRRCPVLLPARLHLLLGSDLLGDDGRDVPEPDPRQRHVPGLWRRLLRQLPCRAALPLRRRMVAGRRLLGVLRLRRAGGDLRQEVSARDQRQVPRGNGRLSRFPSGGPVRPARRVSPCS